MKKYAKITVLLLLVCLLSLALFACVVDNGNDTQGKMTLVLLPTNGDAKEFSVDLSKLPSGDNSQTGLMAVLDYLQDNNQLTYTLNGTMLSQVGDVKEGNGYWVYLYTDVESDFDLTQYASQITYKDKSYTNSGLGASEMTMKEGCTVIITLIYFG